MKVKVGDNVKILAGKDKGKTGKVIRTLKHENRVVVEGINMIKKHSKPTNTNDKGGIFDIEAPIHVSNVKVEVVEKKPKAPKAPKVAAKEEKPAKATAKKAAPKTEAKAEKPAKKTTKKASK